MPTYRVTLDMFTTIIDDIKKYAEDNAFKCELPETVTSKDIRVCLCGRYVQHWKSNCETISKRG